MSLAALVLAGVLQAAAPQALALPPVRVPVSELIGAAPAEVAIRLGSVDVGAEDDVIRMRDGDRSLALYPAQRFQRAWPQGGVCVTGFPEVPMAGDPDPDPRSELMRRSRGWFVFENDRLIAVHPETPVPRRPADAQPATRESTRAFVLGPRPQSVMTVAAGRLPLSDGAGVLDRLPSAPADLSVTSACVQLPERAPPRRDVGMDVIWAMVGLTVLPFVPFQKVEESRADREGGALLDAVEPGSALPGGAEAFVGRRRGVRVYRDAVDPGFAVIAVRLGNGADNVADVGLLGVRDDRVVWEVRRDAGRASLATLICRDGENRPSDGRPGCNDYGYLRP